MLWLREGEEGEAQVTLAMGNFQLEDFAAGWIGGECACQTPPPPPPHYRANSGGPVPAVCTWCSRCALQFCIAGFYQEPSERRLQHLASLAQSAWLVLSLTSEAELLRFTVISLSFWFASTSGSEELGSHND